jgi:hypothetical protein
MRTLTSLHSLTGLCSIDFNISVKRPAHLPKAGVHPKIVSGKLNHASIGITLDTHSHVVAGLQGKAVEGVDDLVTSTGDGKVVAEVLVETARAASSTGRAADS